jgi:hypothetical protein
MGKYLTINSQFNPISFEEMAKMPLMYKAEREKQEDKLDELSKYSTLEALSNSSLNRDVYGKYQAYKNKLADTATRLQNTGKLDARSIRDLQREYNQVISPYEKGYEEWKAIVDKQAKESKPWIMQSVDYSNMSLDDFMKSNHSYTSIDLNEVTKDAATQILSDLYSGEINKTNAAEKLEGIYNGYDTRGYTDAQKARVVRAIKNGVSVAEQNYIAEQNKRAIERMKAQTQSASYEKNYWQAQKARREALGLSGSGSGSGGSVSGIHKVGKMKLPSGDVIDPGLYEFEKDGKKYYSTDSKGTQNVAEASGYDMSKYYPKPENSYLYDAPYGALTVSPKRGETSTVEETIGGVTYNGLSSEGVINDSFYKYLGALYKNNAGKIAEIRDINELNEKCRSIGLSNTTIKSIYNQLSGKQDTKLESKIERRYAFNYGKKLVVFKSPNGAEGFAFVDVNDNRFKMPEKPSAEDVSDGTASGNNSSNDSNESNSSSEQPSAQPAQPAQPVDSSKTVNTKRDSAKVEPIKTKKDSVVTTGTKPKSGSTSSSTSSIDSSKQEREVAARSMEIENELP